METTTFWTRQRKLTLLALSSSCWQILPPAAAPLSMADSCSFVPLKQAVQNDHAEAVRVILAALQSNPLFNLNSPDFDATHSTSSGVRMQRTILYLARSAAVAQLLLDHGAHTNLKDKYGRTPLHVAAQVQRTDVARCLLEHSPQLLLQTDQAGNIALLDATEIELVESVLTTAARM
jgi:ankyrin repeat protein